MKALKRWYREDIPVNPKTQWMEHLRNIGPSGWPRDVGIFPGPRRHSISSLSQMMDRLWENRESSDLFIQVYSDTRQEANLYDTIYLDLDADTSDFFEETKEGYDYIGSKEERKIMWRRRMEDVHWEFRRLHWYLETEWDITPRVYFSGSRGFSVYIDIPQIQVQYGAIKDLIKKTVIPDSDVDPDFVDMSVLESNRISRPPYSINWNHKKKHGLWPGLVLPIDPHWSFDRFYEEITDPSEWLEVDVRRQSTDLIDQIVAIDEDQEFQSDDLDPDNYQANPARARKRIKFLMERADRVKDGRNRVIIFMLVPALIEVGYEDRSDIHRFVENWINQTGKPYHEEYQRQTNTAIDRTIEYGYKPWTIPRFFGEHTELLDSFVG